MERYLLRLILGIAVVSICLPVFSQVNLSERGDTKFYENGTRITYFKMAGFPNSPEMREYVSKMVLENPDIKRVDIYRNGETFMYEAMQSIEPDMIVDAVNDALKEFKEQNGDFPPNDSPSTNKPKSNVTVTPHKATATADVKSQPSGVANQKFEATEKKSVSQNGEHQMNATPVDEVRQAPAVEGRDANTKSLEKFSPANNNTNSKNR